MFEDVSFPPNKTSLGDVGIDNVKWKRITEFISYPGSIFFSLILEFTFPLSLH